MTDDEILERIKPYTMTSVERQRALLAPSEPERRHNAPRGKPCPKR